MINFQLFADIPAELEGIDEEVLELLKDEFPQPEAAAEEPEQAEPEQPEETEMQPETEPEQEAPADADSDNKQVAENVPGNIPYARFKQQNDKLKSVEKELAELKARYEAAQQVPPQPVYQQQQYQQPVQQQAPADNGLDEREVMSAVTQEAIRRAQERLHLTDDDVSNLDFSDDIQTRYQFQTIVQQESNAILEQARRNSQERIAREQKVQQANSAYTNFVNQFQAQPDAAERWQYIAEERFLQLDQFEQDAIKSAFERLQKREGTPGDFFLATSYFNRASKEFDDKKKPVSAPAYTPAPKTTTAAEKIRQAQALPKAPNVQGAMSTAGMSVDDIAELMNKPGNAGIDKIPRDIWDKILRGESIS